MPDKSSAYGLREPVLVSACLLGLACRYDGSMKQDLSQQLFEAGYMPIPVCPEQLGGLATPRSPAVFRGGDGAAVIAGKACLVNSDGLDVTANFIQGSDMTCRIAVMLGVRRAVLKEKSPSCGINLVTVEDVLQSGRGVTAARLLDMGIELTNEDFFK